MIDEVNIQEISDFLIRKMPLQAEETAIEGLCATAAHSGHEANLIFLFKGADFDPASITQQLTSAEYFASTLSNLTDSKSGVAAVINSPMAVPWSW